MTISSVPKAYGNYGIDVGLGYRVYYTISGQNIVLLLGGGDKNTQAKDIAGACRFLKDWQRR